jgi:hypothetical protein
VIVANRTQMEFDTLGCYVASSAVRHSDLLVVGIESVNGCIVGSACHEG